jgi:hypothetical protein
MRGRFRLGWPSTRITSPSSPNFRLGTSCRHYSLQAPALACPGVAFSRRFAPRRFRVPKSCGGPPIS